MNAETDKTDIVTSANRKFRELTGYTKENRSVHPTVLADTQTCQKQR